MKETHESISVHVGKAFYDFDVSKLELNARVKFSKLYPNKKLDHVFVFVTKNGQHEDFFSFCFPDNIVGNTFGSHSFNNDGSLTLNYDFKESGLYVFNIVGYTEEDEEFHTEDFLISLDYSK